MDSMGVSHGMDGEIGTSHPILLSSKNQHPSKRRPSTNNKQGQTPTHQDVSKQNTVHGKYPAVNHTRPEWLASLPQCSLYTDNWERYFQEQDNNFCRHCWVPGCEKATDCCDCISFRKRPIQLPIPVGARRFFLLAGVSYISAQRTVISRRKSDFLRRRQSVIKGFGWT
jgi:hypothetical protein